MEKEGTVVCQGCMGFHICKSVQFHGGTLLLNEGDLSSSPIPIVRDRSFYPGTFLVIASNFVGIYKSVHNSCHLYRTMHPTEENYA